MKLDKAKAEPGSSSGGDGALTTAAAAGPTGEKKAKREKKNSREKSIPVSVTHVETVSRIWVVDEDCQETLNDIMSELAAVRDNLQPALAPSPEGCDGEGKATFEEGKLYAARYGCDGDLYRVRVIGCDDHHGGEPVAGDAVVTVEYIDYGNTEEVEVADIFLLPPALAEGSPLARPISIRGAQFALDCEEARERLKSHLTEGSIQLLGSSSSRGQDTLLMVDGKPINLQYLLKYKVKYHYEKYRYSLRKFFSLKMLL